MEYALAVRRNDVPENIQVCEFFFRPGAFMNHEHAQLNYISTNYTHAVRDLMDNGINVAAQLVSAERRPDGRESYSYSCNPEVALDLVPAMRRAEREGRPVAIAAQVNRNLPYMYGDSEVDPDHFDAILDHPDYEFPLFAPPKESVSTQDYMIGLHVSSLVRDGGTLQIGIGSLGDAIAYGSLPVTSTTSATRSCFGAPESWIVSASRSKGTAARTPFGRACTAVRRCSWTATCTS